MYLMHKKRIVVAKSEGLCTLTFCGTFFQKKKYDYHQAIFSKCPHTYVCPHVINVRIGQSANKITEYGVEHPRCH